MTKEITPASTSTQPPANLTSFFETLGIERANSDSEKAQMLGMLVWFANNVKNPALAEAAKALMPAADPFRPPKEWREYYNSGFSAFADEDCGTYLDDMPRYGVEYWQAFTDIQRQERLRDPSMGELDGQTDADNLNAATEDVASITTGPASD